MIGQSSSKSEFCETVLSLEKIPMVPSCEVSQSKLGQLRKTNDALISLFLTSEYLAYSNFYLKEITLNI